MALDPAWAGITGAVLGAAVTGLFNLLNNISRRRSEEKNHMASLTVSAAVENWKRLHEGRQGEDILPFDIYLVHMAKLTKEILNEDITKDSVVEKLKKVDAIVQEMQKYANSCKGTR